MKRKGCSLILAGMLLLLSGCTTPADSASRVPGGTLAPTAAPATSRPAPQDGPTDWQTTRAGVDWRRVEARDAQGASDLLLLVRFDPPRLHVRVAYDWTSPGTVREWAGVFKPLLVVNGGYFDRQGRATALVINDGVSHGSSYDGFGGMFAVASDGAISIRPLREQPYDPGENLAQALQSTPMLLLPDGSIPPIKDDGDRARRTIIAKDRQGRIVLIVSPRPSFTLSGIASWLRDSDLELESALNLDGGSSTGIFLQRDSEPLIVDSLVRVPAVIVVEAP